MPMPQRETVEWVNRLSLYGRELKSDPNSTTLICCRFVHFVGEQVVQQAVQQYIDMLGCCGSVYRLSIRCGFVVQVVALQIHNKSKQMDLGPKLVYVSPGLFSWSINKLIY